MEEPIIEENQMEIIGLIEQEQSYKEIGRQRREIMKEKEKMWRKGNNMNIKCPCSQHNQH